MRLAAVLGWPVAHSRSPSIMNAAFAATGIAARMDAIAVRPEELAGEVARLRALPMLGASVTVPHKIEVAKLCDELRGDASALGAVNCLALEGGRLIGHNTDVAGFRDSLGFAPEHAVVLGAGGSARAVVQALGHATVVSRRPATWTPSRPWSEVADAFADADLVVDCTPVGLGDDREFAEALPLAQLPPHATVATLVYHRRTHLLELAAARGHRTLDGRLMLIYQAAHAFTIWTGVAAPVDVMMKSM